MSYDRARRQVVKSVGDWRRDIEGNLLAPSGAVVCKVTHDRSLWLWDKRDKCSRRMTLDELAALMGPSEPETIE